MNSNFLSITACEYKDIELLVEDAKKANLVFSKKTEYYILTNDKNELVGMHGMAWYPKKLISKNSYILPEFRGRGYFKQVMVWAIIQAKKRGKDYFEGTCTKMSLKVLIGLGAEVVKEYKQVTTIRIKL